MSIKTSRCSCCRGCSDQNPGTNASSLFFKRIPKHSDTYVVFTFLFPALKLNELVNSCEFWKTWDYCIQTDRQIDGYKIEKNLKIQHCQCWSRRYWVSVLPTRYRGCHPKGLIVASKYNKKQIIIIKNFSKNNNKNSTNTTLPMPNLAYASANSLFSFKQKKYRKREKNILVNQQNFTTNLIRASYIIIIITIRTEVAKEAVLSQTLTIMFSPWYFLEKFRSILIYSLHCFNSSPETRITYTSWASQ